MSRRFYTFEQMKHFDYIFAGTGLSALMTVYRMIVSHKFENKTILLLDSDVKKTNDRTWCFWEQGSGDWETIVNKRWDFAYFSDVQFKRKLDLQPYQYKMIEGIDFYNFIFTEISKQSNITFLNQKVSAFSEIEAGVEVRTEAQIFHCNKLLNSIYNPHKVKNQTKYPLLQQHFIGWKIKSDTEIFQPDCATFMDFSVAQKGNTRFMYVLPTSKSEALVEYTLFSKDLLAEKEYEDAISEYLQKMDVDKYEILEKEKGNIPMTVYPFEENNSKNILNIGSAGGWTKASTGYTFKNSDKKSKQLVAFLETQSDFRKFQKPNKFRFYDTLLLDILDQRNETGAQIFSALFKRGNAALIFKFLDEETSFAEDLQIILKCPKTLFIKALFSRLLHIKL